MKKINILFILPKTEQGGAETQMMYLLQGLNKTQFNIYLGILYSGEQLNDKFKSIKGIKLIDFKKRNKYDIFIHFRIAKFIKTNKIDIIYSFLGNHHAYIPSLISKPKITLGGIRNNNISKLRGINKTKSIIVNNLLNKIINYKLISNNYAAKKIYAEKGFNSNNIIVIPNGIDLKKYTKGNKRKIIKELNLQDKFIIITVGRLIKSKNHFLLIENLEKLLKQNTNLVLLIIGDGPEKHKLKLLIEKLNLSKQIILTGNREDISDILSATDLFIFPSTSEGWPNVIGEAMAAGTPIITYNSGDVDRIIKNNVDGIITKNDMPSFVNEIKYLINNKKNMDSLSKKAQKKIKENFSLNKMIKQYETIFKNLVRSEK